MQARYTLTSRCADAGALVWSKTRQCWVAGSNQSAAERLTGPEVDALYKSMVNRGSATNVSILDCVVMDAIHSTFTKAFEAALPDGWNKLQPEQRIRVRTDAARIGRDALISARYPTDYADNLGYKF